MATRYSFGRIPDRALVKLSEKIFEQAEAGDSTANFVYGNRAQINISVSNPGSAADELKIFTATSYLIQRATISVPSVGFTIHYRRGEIYQSVQGQGMTWLDAPTFVDGIMVEGPTEDPSANSSIFLPLIAKAISFAPPVTAASGATSIANSPS